MTLTEALRIKERYLQFEDLNALDHCEKRWQEESCPVTRWDMVNFLEKMIRELPAIGIGYPKVLLLRKKQIQRREFAVDLQAKTNSSNCSCNRGWLPSGSPCPCPKGDGPREQLRKWGMPV